MNEMLKLIADRRTCRSYTGELPPEELLQAVAVAGIQSPSAVNRQLWQVIVLRDKAFIDEIEADCLRIVKEMEDQSMYERIMSRGGKPWYNTPCVIFVAADPASKYMALDCGILTQSMALAAHSVGLGSCINAMCRVAFDGVNGKSYKERLGFNPGYELGLALLVGYPAAPPLLREFDLTKISYVG